ncbi:cobalt-precorrin 5A hydrolase [Candidatus Manganitrophus noduliformans]|uniref:Cobalamin biosynthesis protein n=1 Tax=Candidatus Manganitrophus noduliformans TaxID=2606439 RepID=A0A7X6DVE5_9BACT|nr:cobalamin biosynthesis protein [Candidatus Manganitrophus noduliformans]NKE73578.1 cobalamin biosynthesis protein [Candidatus Manganitrophus noduliformans]
MQMSKDLAIVAITKGGMEIARRLRDHFSEADFLISEKFAAAAGEGVIPLKGPLSKNVGEFFHAYDKIVFLVSLGAVVRLIAPHLKDKHVDPAVLVVDDRAQFVISVLSGHVGGANAFTETVAKALGAAPVITTASDVGKTIPVDILGWELGWILEGEEHVTRVSASVVNEEPVAFLQETGEKSWWTRPTPLPPNIECFTSLEALMAQEIGRPPVAKEGFGKRYGAYLIVTDRSRSSFPGQMQDRTVLYRPKSLDLGMGCDRGTPIEEIEELIGTTLEKNGLSMASVRALATLDQKSDEPAFLQLCEKNGWKLVAFSKEELQQVEGILTPSAVVEKWVGTPSVSEAAALRSSGASALLIPKVKAKRATLAVARVVFS